ncbi:MAG: serine hydrolase [Bacteroidetes bacterium]|nr:serine hydrolase [Bacteroidota bacterium]
MKKLIYYLVFFFISSPVFTQTIPETIDELLKVYSKQYAFNGSVLVAQKGNIILQKGYGYKNWSSHSLNDEKTIFQVGSITKQFTAVAILQLQQKKLLSVQDNIDKYVPGFPNGDKITIEHLLTHTSGIPNYTNDNEFMKTGALKAITPEKLIELFKNKPLEFAPGEKYNYSNSGYVLLGYIIEKITGKSYFSFIRENILQPLHMDHSGFDFKSLKNTDKATGYFKLTAKTNQPATIIDSSASYAAGALYTTVGDLFKWDRGLYTGQIIDTASLSQAFVPHKSNYGYGWIIDSSYNKKILMHDGGIFGFESFVARIPEDETCIILLDNHQCNQLPKIAEEINAIIDNQPYEFPLLRKEIDVAPSILKQYVGEYQLAPNINLSIYLEDGQLVAQVTGQGKVELYAERDNFFFTKIVKAQLEFFKDADGKVTRVTLSQDGQQVQGKKIK